MSFLPNSPLLSVTYPAAARFSQARPGSIIARCACAASASGNSLPITGRNVPFSKPATSVAGAVHLCRRCRQFQTGARHLCRFIEKAWRHFACRCRDGRRHKVDIEAAAKAGLKTIAFLCAGTSESALREAGGSRDLPRFRSSSGRVQ